MRLTRAWLARHFGDIWPAHDGAFTALLVTCRRCLDGALDQMLIRRGMGRRNMAIVIIAAALATGACGGGSVTPEARPGGYAPVAVNDQQVVAAATFAVDAQRLLVSGTGDPVVLELVSVSAAEQQVVSGINYRLTLRVRRDGAEQIADAVVWWQAWRQPDPYRLTSWEWR